MKVLWKLIAWALLGGVASIHAGDGLSAKVLKNGLQVIVIQNHTVPLATVSIVFKNGSYTETPEENGLTHLHTHMLFKANQSYPTRESLLERTRELGAITQDYCREEWVNLQVTLPADSLRPGLDFISQSVMYPLFLGDQLALEKQVVRDEIEREAANPGYHLVQARRAKLWGRNFCRKNYLGDRRVVRSATLEQIRLIQERYVIPNNTALLVSGDVKPRVVFRMAKEFFGEWEPGPDPAQAHPVPTIAHLEAHQDTVVVQPVNNAEILMAWHGPSVGVDVKGTFAADVFSLILNQRTSELQKNLVGSGIALKVSAIYLTQKHVGPILIGAVCRPQKYREAYQTLQAEIEKFADPEYFSDQQLATAKTLLEVEAIYKGDKASGHVEEVGFWWAIAGLEYYRDYLDNLRAVSREDIQQYLNTYIIGKPHVTATMVNRETRRQWSMAEESRIQ
ncbi:MAG: insulinase family protein [Fidelibacterota bacterium]|nr:MAG: insulinase family protein [Candidatus Neomarinimicrobiota bacterium]